MISISNLLCDHSAGNEKLRYGHKTGEHPDGVPRPVVVWAVTRACNLKCVHCYASATSEPDPEELTFEQGKAVLDDLKAFNVPAVLFSGGEPLVREDTTKLVAYAQELGMRCTLSTNGILIDDAMAAQIKDLGMTYVGISIDGMKDVHDKLRGLKGAFEGAKKGIRHCREHNIKVGVRFTVHALNHQYLDDIYDFCIDNDIQRLCVYHLAYAGRGNNMQNVDLTAQQTREVVDRIFIRTQQCHDEGRPLEVLTVGNHTDAAYILMHLEKTDPKRAKEVWQMLQGTGGNRSGCNISAIDPQGYVHYDQFSWHHNCGNVKDRPFSEIWKLQNEPVDSRLAILRDRTPHLPPRCQGCRFVSICNGNLRTRAESATDDWLGDDPSCYLTDAEIAHQEATQLA